MQPEERPEVGCSLPAPGEGMPGGSVLQRVGRNS